jgi:hypothetical protein
MIATITHDQETEQDFVDRTDFSEAGLTPISRLSRALVIGHTQHENGQWVQSLTALHCLILLPVAL